MAAPSPYYQAQQEAPPPPPPSYDAPHYAPAPPPPPMAAPVAFSAYGASPPPGAYNAGPPPGTQGTRDSPRWAYSLCSCCDDDVDGCLALVLTPCTYRTTQASLESPPREVDCNDQMLACVHFLSQFLFGLGCILTCYCTHEQRKAIKTRYNMNPFDCCDIMISFFCMPCALEQQSSEVDWREPDHPNHQPFKICRVGLCRC
eukprot:c12588_g1_i1.p1 GENE.c12588_g1_i1~~c12588_g1_i1.p1  ORF type:complete len:202 (-),score=12.99 c12588_g1_i1:59-664(-)